MFKLDLEKAEEPEIKLPTSAGSVKGLFSSLHNENQIDILEDELMEVCKLPRELVPLEVLNSKISPTWTQSN